MVLEYSQFFLQYTLIYSYFLLVGRSFLIIFKKYLFKDQDISKKIFNINQIILFPVLGIVFVGNILVITNFFLPLSNLFIYAILIGLLVPNLLQIQNNFNFSFTNIIYYLIIPGILIFSTFDIPFHYDAGYYHLNTQNWLRESNIVLGFVNIFWPFGMSSIYEYLSAVLWVSADFVFLHFLNLIFIQFFYLVILDSFIFSKYIEIKNAAFFVILFSIFDNFGFGGGRNGFLYIQGVGKQDIAVGVLFFFLSICMLISIKNKMITKIELIILPILCLFIFQLKVSGAIVFYLYTFLFLIIFKSKQYEYKELIYTQLPFLFFSIIWFIKNILTTGCLIFPLAISCINSFEWYIPNSTEGLEYVTKQSSLILDLNQYSFNEWLTALLVSDLNRGVLFNFIFSILILFLIKLLFFSKAENPKNFITFIISYVLLNILFLIFFGPIPRYAIGIMITVAALFGFFSGVAKINLSKNLFIFLTVLSTFLIVRLSSYNSFINDSELFLFDPREDVEINIEVGFTNYNDNWVFPSKGDQCWINIECSMAKANIIIEENGRFKIAYKK